MFKQIVIDDNDAWAIISWFTNADKSKLKLSDFKLVSKLHQCLGVPVPDEVLIEIKNRSSDLP